MAAASLMALGLYPPPVLDLHPQFAHAHPGRVVHRIREGSGDAGQADLADPVGALGVDLRVRGID